jgi:hypothetical protein
VTQAMVPAQLRQELDGLGAAITIYAVMCCAILALSAFEFYELMRQHVLIMPVWQLYAAHRYRYQTHHSGRRGFAGLAIHCVRWRVD